MRMYGTFFLLFGLLFFVSCKPENVGPETGTVQFMIAYSVDDQPLAFDSLQYTNQAGNAYSVANLEYFISDLVLVDELGNETEREEVFYVNPRKYPNAPMTIPDVELKNYASIRFSVGLNAENNQTNALPFTIDNQNMAWPEPMGGGYHFLKLEGHYLDSLGSTLGYAMHLGTNTCLVNCVVDQAFSISEKDQVLELDMNLNEWFRTPNAYDLNSGGYIMGNQDKMKEIAENGSNVFQLK